MPEIAKDLHIPESTIYSWRTRDKWDKASVAQKVEAAIDTQLIRIINKGEYSDKDHRAMNTLGVLLERMAKITKYQHHGSPKDLNPKLSNRGAKTSQEKNELSEADIEKLDIAFREMFEKYAYQWELVKIVYQYDIVNLLKSRQIGLTFFFALLAILDAAKTGDNWIFLSASKNQAHIFKNYIVKWVRDVCDIELKGDPIKLANGAELYFLGTNKNTAQGYHGHMVSDEYQWIHKFKEFQEASSGMAMQSKWREIYITTPSNTLHDGWKFWDGSHFNKGRKKDDQIELDVSHKKLKNGRLCEDGQYRQIITVEDAIAKGCDFFDLEKLRLKYSTDAFNNLLMCQPIDDTLGIFTLEQMQRCMVDSWEKWLDFEPLNKKPYAGSVWIGYDPSRSRDDAGLCVIAPPIDSGPYRILEKFSWQNLPFEDQAKEIKKLTQRYNVTHIGIDESGMGVAVLELVQKFYPAAVGIHYSVDVKNRLVLKLMHLINKKRLQFDSGWNDFALACMTIRQTSTAKSGQITYQADRSSDTGHADLAWAAMHALDKIELRDMVSQNDEDDSSNPNAYKPIMDIN